MTNKKHSHYYKSVSKLNSIDVYRVCDLFGIDDKSGSIQHAIKKLLVAGGRGAGKDYEKDLREAIDSIKRKLELLNEDAVLPMRKEAEVETPVTQHKPPQNEPSFRTLLEVPLYVWPKLLLIPSRPEESYKSYILRLRSLQLDKCATTVTSYPNVCKIGDWNLFSIWALSHTPDRHKVALRVGLDQVAKAYYDKS